MENDSICRDVVEQKRYWEVAIRNMIDVGTPNFLKECSDVKKELLQKEFTLDKRVSELVNKTSNQSEQLIQVIFMAALATTISLCYSVKTICLGVPPTEAENPNSLMPMVLDVHRAKDFKSLLVSVRAQYINVLKYQEYNIQDVLRERGSELDIHRMMSAVVINVPVDATSYQDVAEPLLKIKIVNKDISVVWRAAAKETQIVRMHKVLQNVLEQGLKNIIKPLPDFELITDDKERDTLLNKYQGEKQDFLRNKNVVELFIENARKYPDKNAIESLDGNITYEEMRKYVERLAYQLKQKGIDKESHVAILTNRSIETILSIYSIIKLGASYVPIETDYPDERIHYMIQDSNSKLLLVSKSIQTVPDVSIEVMTVDREDLKSDVLPAYEGLPDKDGPCYVIYTSGTTGRPKGVEIYNEGLVNLCSWFKRVTDITETSKIILLNPFGFDASVKNIFTPFMYGATLVLGPEILYDTQKVLDITKNYGVTHLNCVPSLFYALLDTDKDVELEHLKGVKYVIVGGEALQPKPLASWAESNIQAKLLNVYGPTECTSVTTAYLVPKEEVLENIPISIGKPIDNKLVYVLNKNNKLCPIGVEGELFISGIGTAEKYLSAPEGYETAFQPNIFDTDQIMYKTGDIVRWNEDGLLEFLGRKDGQVKINGHRVELSEIEAILAQCAGVKETVVLLQKERNGKEAVIAFVVSDNDETTEQVIKSFANQYIPSYMIPSQIEVMKQFPRTFNGKTDKRALLATLQKEKKVEQKYTANSSTVQGQLEQIWTSLLGVECVDYDVNFFDAGGYSLLLYKLSKKIEETFSIRVSYADLMSYTTINTFAEFIERSKREEKKEVQQETQEEGRQVSAYKKRLESLRNRRKKGNGASE